MMMIMVCFNSNFAANMNYPERKPWMPNNSSAVPSQMRISPAPPQPQQVPFNGMQLSINLPAQGNYKDFVKIKIKEQVFRYYVVHKLNDFSSSTFSRFREFGH